MAMMYDANTCCKMRPTYVSIKTSASYNAETHNLIFTIDKLKNIVYTMKKFLNIK